MSRLAGKVAIVTGGANGIGKATAQLFAEQGAAVCAVDLLAKELQETVTEIEKAGGKIFGFEADVTKEEQVEAFVRETERKYGGVDILCNNAGISGPIGPLDELTRDGFEKVMDVNVTAVWLGMKHCVDAMKRRGGGAIVNTSSTAGLRGAANALPYIASKHAVVGMTKAAAIELARSKIRVNAVCPGITQTRMGQALVDYMGENAVQEFLDTRLPSSRIAEPREIANLIVFLSSDEASYITGGVHSVDGGLTAT